MSPVVLDTPGHYSLAELGHTAPIVLTERRRTGPVVAFEVPGGGAAPYLKVRLRFRLTLDPRSGTGFGLVNALTDGAPSAGVELKTRRAGGTFVTRTSAVSLNGVEHARFRGRIIATGMTNYVLRRVEEPGEHTLGFSLESYEGMRVRRVVIAPSSGVVATRQPPSGLAVAAEVPRRIVRGRPFQIRLRARNVGLRTARRVRFQYVLPGSASFRGRRRDVAWPDIAPGRSRERTLTVRLRRAGRASFQFYAESSVGNDIAETAVRVEPAGAAAGDGAQTPRRGEDAGGGDLPLIGGVIGAGIAGGAIAAIVARRRRRSPVAR